MNGEILNINTIKKMATLENQNKKMQEIIKLAKEKLAKPIMNDTEKEVYSILDEV